MENPDQFQTLLNSLFYNRLSALKDFRRKKQEVLDEEVKREVLENCASDIMLNYDRLTSDEKSAFDGHYGELVSETMLQISMLPPVGVSAESLPAENRYRVNYRVFNIEALF